MTAPLVSPWRSVLRFIADTIAASGYPPSRRDICRRFGWRSTNAAHGWLMKLMARGYITVAASKSRCIALTDAGWEALGYVKCAHCGSRVEPGKAVA